MAFNGNYDGFAPNMPCYQCKTRTATCHGICNAYQKWTREQKIYQRKVKLERKKKGMGIQWNSLYGR